MMPDIDLIDSARSGDADAIAALLAAAQPDIRRYARATCRTADVDDAVQDALCLVHRHVGSLRLVSAFSGWLFAVVKRECLRLARKVKGTFVSIETIEDDLRFASRPNPELRLDLAAAIQSLPAHYRETILMRDMEELTINEIAGRLGATREAVKARLHRARALVREYLKR
ncbi:MAG: sigma-70 family RNA polymerase sigma factor [Devosia sp.]